MLSDQLPLSIKPLPYPKEKLRRCFDIYYEWCKLKNIVVMDSGFLCFVHGQPWSYWYDP